MNKRTMAFLLGSVLLCHASLVYGEVPDYNTVVENTQKENKAVQMFETDDGKGNTVQVAAHQETLYVTARKTGIYTMPSDSSAELAAVSLGDQVEQTAICDNGWSKVEAEADGEKVIGYIQTQALNSENQIVSMDAEEVEVTSDSSILDYPGKKNGITSTGVTATTNHTIAVDPSQIPYGSKVVINGQVYVAEDCGGAIKTNCIDIYVATHAEGEAKGVYYTDVYLIQ